MTHISVVTPVFRNGEVLEELYARLRAALEAITHDFEIIMVEDGGGDGSWDVIAGLAARDPRVKGIQFSRNFGQHPAIAAGFTHAAGEFIVLMDADLQDRPEEIPRLLAACTDNVDIVYTIKTGEVGSLMHRLTSYAFHFVFSKITRATVPENIGTFRLFRRRVLTALLAYPERDILFGPLMFFVGFNNIFVPIPHDKRTSGTSAYSFRKRLALAIRSLVSYTNIPHLMFLYFGLVVVGLTSLYFLAVLFGYTLYGAQLPKGLTLVVLVLLLSLGVTMTCLGILGSYIFRVYQEVLRRPRYSIRTTVNVEAPPVFRCE